MNTSAKKIVTIGSLSIFFLLILAYGFFGARSLIFGVKIKNVRMMADGASVQTGMKVANNIITVTGNAKNAIDLTLDNREISVDQNGNFSETIALLSGYNIINIKAQDKFGYMDEKNYQLMYRPLGN
jgi:Glucodextranase, domain B